MMAYRVKYFGFREDLQGNAQICTTCVSSSPLPTSLWRIPVPAEVSWTSPRFRISTLSILSWLEPTWVSPHPAEFPRHSLFELSLDHVCEYFEFPMRMKSEAIVSLDPVFVDNSQTSKGLETVCHVSSETPTTF